VNDSFKRIEKNWIVYLCVTLLLLPSIFSIITIHKITAIEETHDWRNIEAGHSHSVALTPDGNVVAWGQNTYNQLAVPIEAKADIVSVSAGHFHSLALTSTGKVVAWGDNLAGQSDVPEEAKRDIVAVSAGGNHSLALTSSGKVIAWGSNNYGQSTVPIEAQSDIVAISAGGWHSLALTSSGEIIAWGDNDYNKLQVPDEAQGDVVKISAGSWHSLALTSSGEVFVWGSTEYVPNEIQNDTIAISAGNSYSLALTSFGEMIAWGDNVPEGVPGTDQSDIVAISAGFYHALALKQDGTILAWGFDAFTDIPTTDLKSMTVKDNKDLAYDIDFNLNIDEYAIKVDHTISSVNIRAELDEPEYAVVLIGGQKQTDFTEGIDVELTDIKTSIEIEVVPYFTDGKTYTLTVEKEKEPIITFTPNGSAGWLRQQTTTTVSIEHADLNEPLLYTWSNSAELPGEESRWTTFENGDEIQTPSEDGNWHLFIRALDVAGGEKIESSNPFRIDNTPPTLTLLGENPMNISYGELFEDTGYEVTDNLDVDIKNKVIIEGEVNTKKIGSYNLLYSVEDGAGNKATATRTVNVIDEEQPVITLKGDNPLILEVGTPYEELGAIAEDNADGDISQQIKIDGEVDSTKLGTYEIYYYVVDRSGNEAEEVIRTVKVVDSTPPDLNLIGDQEVTIELDETYEEQGFRAIDNYDGDITDRVQISNHVNLQQVGTYEIIYTVEDTSGNVATIVRTVQVIDTTEPTNEKPLEKESTLPKTATYFYRWLLLGTFFIVAAGILLQINNKNKMNK